VDGGTLQLALRELQRHFTDPRVLGGMGLAALILGFAGPFGTFESLETVPRICYWVAVVIATYGVGYAVQCTLRIAFADRLAAAWKRVLLFGLVTGVVVTLAVLAINFVAFGNTGIDVLTLWFNCTLITFGIIALGELLGARQHGASPLAATTSVPILERLPLPQRGTLLSMTVTDHYTEVTTDRGKTLVLIRLSDAMRETGSVAGLQIHRSHWVALHAVKRVIRTDGKLLLELVDGQRLPVSRGYAPAVRAAGLL
jgi:hypothetical protein